MHEKIQEAQRAIIQAFNRKPKDGINQIKAICEKQGISSSAAIAEFFDQNKKNLDLEAVGDYLSGPDLEHQETLKTFTAQMDFKGQDFVDGMRDFLKAFKLPGEAQKIDRLVESFSEAYFRDNPGVVANKDAAYVLAFQTIMLNTDLHNKSISEARKMTLDQLQRNLRGTNNGADFDPKFLETIYNQIKTKAFELNFVKVSPGYEIHSSALNQDPTLKRLESSINSPVINPKTIFPGIGDTVRATVVKPKPWLSFFSGYEGTIALTDSATNAKASVQIYKPGIFVQLFFGVQPKVIVQPTEANSDSMAFAAKIASNFTTRPSSIKSTYDYERSELQGAYDAQKSQATIQQTQDFRNRAVRDRPEASSSKQLEVTNDDVPDETRTFRS